jgi:hypothetical protein
MAGPMGEGGASGIWPFRVDVPGKYPKENIQDSEHGENLKSRIVKS